MILREMLKQCLDDHLNQRGELHCWVDPEGEGGVFSAYGISPSRSYLVCMAAIFGGDSFDGDITIDHLTDEVVNQAFNIRCRGTYIGIFDTIVQVLYQGVDAHSIIGILLD